MRRPGMGSRLAVAILTLCMSAGAGAPVTAANGHQGQSAVANPALLRGLTTSERRALARNGFVVTAPVRSRQTAAIDQMGEWRNADPAHQVYWQYYDLYYENYVLGIPNFVTSDALVHTFHVMYDQTLVALEREIFAPTLERFSSRLMDVATYQYGATRDPRIRAAALLNMGYVSVAQRLLNPRATTPQLVAQGVNAELALIAAHRGVALSPLFGYDVDYSKFVPRGHYTSGETLRRYFQAMTWYGLLTFRLNGPARALETRQALLLVRGVTLVPEIDKLWSTVFDPITAWVGRSDDLTVRDYASVMARVYPANAPVSILADNARLARFIAQANALRDPQIRGDMILPGQNMTTVTKGMRLFGQRFVPDAAIMQALIYDKVGTPQQPRVWPSGLDVAAALGSHRATDLLFPQRRFAHYAEQLSRLRQGFERLPASAWRQNLYWGWLDTLRAVWGAPPPAAPPFMQTTAWATKSLGTGMGSWAELRHDTLLYVKQPTGLGGGNKVTPPPVAYVEPVPLVYQRLLALTGQIKATLAGEGILDGLPRTASPFPISPYGSGFPVPLPTGERGYRAALDGFAALVALCQRVAERELLGQAVGQTDMRSLIAIDGGLSELTMFFQDNGTPGMLPVDRQVAAIADVFTEPISRQVLEVGVGDVLPIYAEVTINGRRWLTRGGVYSYYEFHWPMSDRLTDNAWRHLPRRPAQPAWTGAYIAY